MIKGIRPFNKRDNSYWGKFCHLPSQNCPIELTEEAVFVKFCFQEYRHVLKMWSIKYRKINIFGNQ